MKLIHSFLTFLLFTSLISLIGCSNTHPVTTKNIETTARATNNITILLQDSQKTNSSTAIEQLVQQAASNTNNPEPLFNLAYAHVQNALATHNLHEHDLAIAYYNEVLLLVPGNQAVVQALYKIYYDDTLNNYNSQAFAQATKYFLLVSASAKSKLNPPSLALYVATAIRQEAEHETNHQTLREILLRAIQEQPQNDNSYIQLAKIYSDDRYFSLALATLKLGAENITDSVELYTAIAATYEKRANINGCNYEHLSDIINAATYYKLAIPLNPDSPLLHYNLASSLLDQNLNYLGINESEIALSLDPTSTNLSIMAQSYSILGQTNKANELLEKALRSGLTISDVSYHEIAMNQGDWATAAQGFAAYIKTRDTYSLYELIKSDVIGQQLSQHEKMQLQYLLTNKKISLTSNWEENLFKYWTKKIDADELKKLAHNRCEKTEYYFYSGYQDYQSGNKSIARIKFAEALKQNTYRFIERPLARYFLRK